MQVITQPDFIRLFEQHGSEEMSRITGLSVRSIYKRRRSIENEINRQLRTPNPKFKYAQIPDHPARRHVELKDGVIIVGSDSHYLPGVVTTAHKAFVKFCRELKPAIVIKNGDELDLPKISRHPPIGWENKPAVQAEIECVQDRLEEIEKASVGAKFFWPLGNHDARFETRLATVASEYARVHGFHLKDHFPRWQPCWSVWINDDVVIKHRYKGGIHATHNNTVTSGKSMVTGHLHSLKVTPWTDYGGTRFGVDTGTMAEPFGEQFIDYTEDNPVNWRSGFAVLTFHKGKMLWPEVVHVCGPNQVEFRGKVYDV